jgi:hypothetical protein
MELNHKVVEKTFKVIMFTVQGSHWTIHVWHKTFTEDSNEFIRICSIVPEDIPGDT